MFKQNKLFSIPSVVLLSFVAASSASSDEEQQSFVKVQLSPTKSKAKKQLSSLEDFDILYVDKLEHNATVLVKGNELNRLIEKGFPVSIVEPKWSFDETSLDQYTSPAEAVQFLNRVHENHPEISRLFEVGKTLETRPILGIELTSDFQDQSRPTILFNAMHHAREVMTTEVAIHMIKVLTEGYQTDPEITQWLNSYRIVIVPQVNPDGNHRVHNGSWYWRKNARGIGTSSGAFGVDLNRNYPALWGYCNGSSRDRQAQNYRGESAASEPETKSMMALVSQIRPVVDISYHTYSELVIYPFGCDNVANSALDLFRSVADDINSGVVNDSGKTNGYEVGTAPELLYNADGTDLDWMWTEYGVLAYTLEVNADSQGFHPDYNRWRDVTVDRQTGGWKQLVRRASGPGFKAKLADNINASEITFTISVVQGSERFGWADPLVKPFRPRNVSGLIYQLVKPGKYEVTFYRNNQIVKTLPVSVANGMLDLGVLSF